MREYIFARPDVCTLKEAKHDEYFRGEVVRCKDCKHRPKRTGDECNGFDFEFPDHVCPCQCEDGWYNWMPKDNWFCANGEREEE